MFSLPLSTCPSAYLVMYPSIWVTCLQFLFLIFKLFFSGSGDCLCHGLRHRILGGHEDGPEHCGWSGWENQRQGWWQIRYYDCISPYHGYISPSVVAAPISCPFQIRSFFIIQFNLASFLIKIVIFTNFLCDSALNPFFSFREQPYLIVH